MSIHWFEFLFSGIGAAMLCAIGFASELPNVREADKRINFLTEFRNLFVEWVKGRATNQNLYREILLRTSRAQVYVGAQGVLKNFTPPFANYMLRRYQILPNAIPQINQFMDDDNSYDIASQYVRLVDEALLRSIGSHRYTLEDVSPRLLNPVTLFISGLRWVVTAPVLLLTEFGLISHRALNWYKSSLIAKSFTLGLGAVTLLSIVMTVTLGWDDFVNLLKVTF